jgi:hypothetical protein
MYGAAAIWTLRKVDQKYLKSFEKRCRRRMKKVIWTDHTCMRNEVLHRVGGGQKNTRNNKKKEG